MTAGSGSLGAGRSMPTVLYVEHDPSNTSLVETILLKRPEVTLLVATRGGQGLQLAREHRPALVLLDLNLPDISGEEVLRRLRSDERTQDIRVVMLSADATPGQIARLRRSGADDCLTKPFEIERLLAAVDNLALPDGDRGASAEDDLPEGPLQPEVVENLRDLYPDDDALREFIDLFLSDSPPRLERLVAAIRAGDVDEVWQGAHALRGSCVLVGAHRVQALLEGFEEVVRRGDLPGEAEIAAIQAAYAEAAEALVRELGDS